MRVQELFTTIYIGFLILITTSFLMYLAERPGDVAGPAPANSSAAAAAPFNRSEHPELHDRRIRNFADALWWGVVRSPFALTTVAFAAAAACARAGRSVRAMRACTRH